MNEVDRLEFLVDEIHILEGKRHESDSQKFNIFNAHVNTVVSALKQRVIEVKGELNNEL